MKNSKTLKIASFATVAAACAVSGAFAFNAKTVSADTADFHGLGASIRVAEDKGIRFAFGLAEDKTGEGYEIGTLVIPKSVLGEAELNHNSDTTDTVTVDYEEISCSKNWVPYELIENAKEGYNYYNAALTNIPDLEYNTVLIARSYYVKDGVYTYSEPVERSIGYVASAALNDGFEDKKGILGGIVKTGFGETALTTTTKVEVVDANETIDVTASNDLGYLPVWSTSDETVATVDKTGKVTAKKSGEVTITATIGETTAEKKIYVAGGLESAQIAGLINGYNFTDNTSYFQKSTNANGNIVVKANLISNPSYHSALALRKMHSKDYYEKLANNGYKFTFMLGVSEPTTTSFSDLYVFGKQLTKFPKNANGEYAVVVDAKYIADNYEAISTLMSAQAGASKRDKMFIAWTGITNNYSTQRNYVFTFSNAQFVSGVLFADNIGMRIQGEEKTSDMSWMTVDVGANGEMTISAKFEATAAYNGNGYHATLIFKNIESLEYYKNLVNSGYKYIAFDLKVGGADAANLQNMVIFCGQQISTLTKVGDVYKVKMQLDKLLEFYTTINSIATASGRSGTTGSKSALFLAWRDNRGSDIGQVRNYTFTISNSAYVAE